MSKECPRSVKGLQCWSLVARKSSSLDQQAVRLMILHAFGPEVRRNSIISQPRPCRGWRLWRGPFSFSSIIKSSVYFGLGRAGVGGYGRAPSLVVVLGDFCAIAATAAASKVYRSGSALLGTAPDLSRAR